MKNFKEKIEQLNTDLNKLWSSAYRDSLTQLFNRAALEDVILDELNKLKADEGYAFALLFMDLNGFKQVNDNFGHKIGDQLLVKFANELRKKHGEWSFRLGGDEFIVILSDCANSTAALGKAKQLCKYLSKNYKVDRNQCHIAPSIGVAFCNERTAYESNNKKAIQEVIGNGDAAMYQAKIISKTSLKMPVVQGARIIQGAVKLFEDVQQPIFEIPEYKQIIRNGIGKGILYHEQRKTELDFKLSVLADGEILLSCMKINPQFHEFEIGTLFSGISIFAFEGGIENSVTDERYLIKCDSLQRVWASYRQDEPNPTCNILLAASQVDFIFGSDDAKAIRFYLANFYWPIDQTNVRSLLNVVIDSLHLRFGAYGDMEALEKQLKKLIGTGSIEATSWIEIDLKSGVDVKGIIGIVDTILIILSFLQGSLTNWSSYDIVSEKGDVIRSHCRHVEIARMMGVDQRTAWSAALLEITLPKMYDTYTRIHKEWGLRDCLAQLVTSIELEKEMEPHAFQTICCLERILQCYIKNNIFAEISKLSWNREDFTKYLSEFCKYIKIKVLASDNKVLTSDDESYEEVLFVIVNEVALLRESLRYDGTLNVVESDNDLDIMVRLYGERQRRARFLLEFTQNCIKKLLDPEGQPYAICRHQIKEEKYNGLLQAVKQ